jgi:DNA replicative helicase MCM subunit Mcm2 (Cdc46/Mcm family)
MRVLSQQGNGETDVKNIHLTLVSEATSISVRDLESEQASQLVMTPGIVVASHGIKARNTGKVMIMESPFPTIYLNPRGTNMSWSRQCTRETLRHISSMQKRLAYRVSQKEKG